MAPVTRIVLTVSLAATLLGGAAGCRADNAPDPGAEPTSPAGSAQETVSAERTGAATARVGVYFALGERVGVVHREVMTPAVAREAIETLLDGPTAAETEAGFTTEIPSGTTLLGLTVEDGVARINMSDEFDDGGGTLSMGLRMAELVHTLTQFGTVQRVSLRIDGKPVEMLGGEGILIAEPQTRAMWEDYSPAVLIEHPAFGEHVSSPLRVEGTANTFEGRFMLDLVDPDGTLLASIPVASTSGTGTRGRFATAFDEALWGSGTGSVIAWYDSPKDGSRVEVYSVSIER